MRYGKPTKLNPELNYTISFDAEEDLKKVFSYTLLRWGSSQLQKYEDLLFDAFESICENPRLLGSKSENDIMRGCRSLKVGKHYIFYFEDGETIEIFRVLHEAMDYRKSLF